MTTRSRVLCVGDTERLHELARTLQDAGYDAMLASTSVAALALLQLYPPATVLLDCQDACQFLRLMKRTWPRVPVVLAGVEPFVASGKTLLDNISNLLGGSKRPAGVSAA